MGVRELKKDPRKLEVAILGSIGKFDGKVLTAQEEGWQSASNWLVGVTDEGRQKWREEILKGKVEDFEEFANRLERWNPSVAVVSSKKGLEGAKKEMAGSHLDMML